MSAGLSKERELGLPHYPKRVALEDGDALVLLTVVTDHDKAYR